jgi:hypothetical protein
MRRTLIVLVLSSLVYGSGCSGKENPPVAGSVSATDTGGASTTTTKQLHSQQNDKRDWPTASASINDPPNRPSEGLSVAGLLDEIKRTLGIEKSSYGGLSDKPNDISAWLNRLAAVYDSKREPTNVTRFVLTDDAEGIVVWSSVLFVEETRWEESTNSYTIRRPVSITITKVGEAYLLDSAELPEDAMGMPRVEAVGDLDGDGAKEIVWRWGTIGAHTTAFSYSVSKWNEEGWSSVPGTITMPSVSSFTLEDSAIVLSGGLIGSAGAGPWQRESTDTYKYVDGGMRLVDSRMADATTAYHRLNEAAVSEALGHWDRAAGQYAEASRQTDITYEGMLFQFGQQIVEGGRQPELEKRFGEAVQALARLRLRLLELDGNLSGENSSKLAPDAGAFAGLSTALHEANNRREGANAAKRWAEDNPEWLELLNAPFGYANRRWDAESVSANVIGIKEPGE